MSPLLKLSATQLAEGIREKKWSVQEVLEAHLSHLQEVNPQLNAVVVPMFEQARQEAVAKDQKLAQVSAEELPPLFGVPCTIKESFAVEGQPNTAGLVARKDYRAPEDAITVRRLKDAGAIVMGLTNTSELCMWMEAHNQLYGRTSNPYHPGHISGGSSGGEGAIIGAGASPMGLGADIGGSIRMPAFFNGVFGHKPSPGLVPSSGQWPMPEDEVLPMLGTGPLCRKAEDLLPLIKILAGPDGQDPTCKVVELTPLEDIELSNIRIISVAHDGRKPVQESLSEAQMMAAEHLAQRGAKTQNHRFDGFKHSLDIWMSTLGTGQPKDSFRGQMGDRSTSQLWGHLIKHTRGSSEHTLPAILLGLVENLGKLTPKRNQRFLSLTEQVKQEVHEVLGEDGVMLYPSHPVVAPRHQEPLKKPFRWAYTGLFNALGLCATQIPLGLDQNGLPLGVQAVALPGKDTLTIKVALELEEAMGGWVPPGSKADSQS